jgi:hypothetical protein
MFGLSPGDVLQLCVIVGGGCITIGVVKSDLRNMRTDFGARISRIEGFIDEHFISIPEAPRRRRKT